MRTGARVYSFALARRPRSRYTSATMGENVYTLIQISILMFIFIICTFIETSISIYLLICICIVMQVCIDV